MGRARARLTAIVAALAAVGVALAAIALATAAGAQEPLRVTYAVDRSNPEHVQITGTVFNDLMQDVFDVTVTAEALDARGKVVARGIAHVSSRIPGLGSSPFVCKVPQVAAAVRHRAAVSGYRIGMAPQAP
jgi:pyruvate/2-oxoacid:ferredoxin oxidoreductase alpha subunit